MEERYTHKKYLSFGERCEIAVALKLNPLQVQVWFQNRRARANKQQEAANASAQLQQDVKEEAALDIPVESGPEPEGIPNVPLNLGLSSAPPLPLIAPIPAIVTTTRSGPIGGGAFSAVLGDSGGSTSKGCDTPEPIYSSMAPVAVKVEPGFEVAPIPLVNGAGSDESNEICDLTIAKTLALLASAPVLAPQSVTEIKVEPTVVENRGSEEEPSLGIDLNGAPEIDFNMDPVQEVQKDAEPAVELAISAVDLAEIAFKPEPVALEPPTVESVTLNEAELVQMATAAEADDVPPKVYESTCHKTDSVDTPAVHPVALKEPEQHVNNVTTPEQDSQTAEVVKIKEEVASDSEINGVDKKDPVSPSETAAPVNTGEVAP